MVGDHEVGIKAMLSPNLTIMSVDGGDDVVVSDQSKTEILFDVFVFSGVGANGTGSGNRRAQEALSFGVCEGL